MGKEKNNYNAMSQVLEHESGVLMSGLNSGSPKSVGWKYCEGKSQLIKKSTTLTHCVTIFSGSKLVKQEKNFESEGPFTRHMEYWILKVQ